jgi:hypothetical protein
MISLGRLLALQQKNILGINDLSDVEFKVFSQWGDDGIIHWLINNIEIENEVFLEFGVEDYTESNTRFLLMNNNWSGTVFDGDKSNINFVKKDSLYWKHDLNAQCCFITKENINDLISKNVEHKDVGLLSIDIDGNDYWVWKEIIAFSPQIVICEFNGLWGSDFPWVIPYQENFNRNKAHFSNLYFGASVKALINLAITKGYVFIGTNSAGNNAYFIRNDLEPQIKNKIKEYRIFMPKFRESRSNNGQLSYLSKKEALGLIKELELMEPFSFKPRKIRDIFSLESEKNE